MWSSAASAASSRRQPVGTFSEVRGRGAGGAGRLPGAFASAGSRQRWLFSRQRRWVRELSPFQSQTPNRKPQ